MKNKNNNWILVLYFISIVGVIVLLTLFVNNKTNNLEINTKNIRNDNNTNKKDNNNFEISKEDEGIKVINLNLLKDEANSKYDNYNIEAISPFLFIVKNYTDKDILYDIKGKVIFESEKLFYDTVKSTENLVYIEDDNDIVHYFDIYGEEIKYLSNLKLSSTDALHIDFISSKLYMEEVESFNYQMVNFITGKKSLIYECVFYYNDSFILVSDGNRYQIINSDFEVVYTLDNGYNYRILNDKYLFKYDNNYDSTKDNYVVDINGKEIKNVKKMEYYSFNGDFVEICDDTQKCGVENIDNNNIIIPISYTDFSTIGKYFDDTFSSRSSVFYIVNKWIIIENEAIYSFEGKKILDLSGDNYIEYISDDRYLIEHYKSESKEVLIYDYDGKKIYDEELKENLLVDSENDVPFISFSNDAGKEGIIKNDGSVFLNFDYDNIYLYDKFYILEKDNKQSLYDFNQNEIFPLDDYNIESTIMVGNYDGVIVQNKKSNDIFLVYNEYNFR